MINKKKLEKAFMQIFSSNMLKKDVLNLYRSYIKKQAKEKNIVPDSEEYKLLFINEEKEALPWIISRMVDDYSLNYINKNMEYIPIVEFPIDETLKNINDEILNAIRISRSTTGENLYHIRPLLFDKKGCLVGSSGFTEGGFVDNFQYTIGDFKTYILEDGSVVIVEERTYTTNNKVDDNTFIVRKINLSERPLLNDFIDVMFDDENDEDFDDLMEMFNP